jgi:uncharacterized damage-inducible protein DinB
VDRAAIREIFEYDEWAWRTLIDQLAAMGDELLTRPAPGSGWPALANCLSHMIVGYQVWLETIDGKPRVQGDAMAAVQSWGELAALAEQVRKRFREKLAALSDDELQSDIEVTVYRERLKYTPAELLGNLVLHERGHHGDVNTLLYQLGLPEQGVPDYRWFVNHRRGYPGL